MNSLSHHAVPRARGIQASLIVPLAGLVILGACSGKGSQAGIATWTPTPSATATCPPNVPLTTPEGWESSTRLFVILYDPRAKVNPYLEGSNGARTADISSLVTGLIPKILGPGDQVSVFQLGYKTYVGARVTRLYSYTSKPQLYNTPFAREPLTPLPESTPVPPGFEAVKATNDASSLMTARAATEMANAAAYSCEVAYWNSNAKLTATAWKQTETAEVGAVSLDMTRDVGAFTSTPVAREPSFPSFELYDGLSHAAIDVASDCGHYERCILIVVDDLLPWVQFKPDRSPPVLKGVSVYVVMPECRDIYQPDCKVLQDYWDAEFKAFGATKPVYMNGIRVETNLLQGIGR